MQRNVKSFIHGPLSIQVTIPTKPHQCSSTEPPGCIQGALKTHPRHVRSKAHPRNRQAASKVHSKHIRDMQGAPEAKPRRKTAAGLGHLEGIISSKAQEKPAEKRQSFIRGPPTTKPHPRNNQAASKLPQGSSKSDPVSIFPFLLPTILALYAPHRYPCPGVGVSPIGWRSSFCTGGAINYAEAVPRVLLG